MTESDTESERYTQLLKELDEAESKLSLDEQQHILAGGAPTNDRMQTAHDLYQKVEAARQS